MKKLLIVLIFFVCGYTPNILAQVYPIIAMKSSPVNTDTQNARYEFIQSTLNTSYAFLIDKVAGKVWRYRIGGKKFEEIPVEDADTVVDDTQIKYQLYISGENTSMCFLLNVHTGQIWRYGSTYGGKAFKKLKMPWFSE